MSATQTAKISSIHIGNLVFEGLMLEDGSFAIAVPQVCSIFQFLIKNASRDLKALLGNDFQFLKVRTTLNPKSVNVLQLKDFDKLILELVIKGNQQAIEISRDLVGLSMQQLFCDSFGIKFEAAERQAWLLARMHGKTTRRGLTDAIKDWYTRNPNGTTRPQHAMYAQTTNLIYQRLWGMTAIELEAHLNCDRNKSRDFLDEQSLKLLDRAEGNVMDFIDLDNIKPVDAVPLANIRPAKMKPEP